METVQEKTRARSLREERRKFQRVSVNLLGRYMLADRREFPCQVMNMSPGGMAIIAPVNGRAGERVIVYVDHIGRVEGTVVREFENGFAMSISATPRKRDKLASQLTWLANRHILGLPEDRRHGRITPKNPITKLTLPDGKTMTCRLIDMSLSGAAVATEERPTIGSLVHLGKVQARVVRHLEQGFAAEFTRLQDPDILEESVTGS
jgi:c-di-GMP-binding flagellar brake protein YcgR